MCRTRKTPPLRGVPGINARNWFQDAYSPRTGLIYTPASNQCGTQKVIEGKFVPGEDYTLERRPSTRIRSLRERQLPANCRPTIR